MDINFLRSLIADSKIKLTTHCLERMGERNISIADVKNCILSGTLIEDYPNDFPHPSALIFGYAKESRIIHVVVGHDDNFAYLITAYIPNNKVFNDDLMTRRQL